MAADRQVVQYSVEDLNASEKKKTKVHQIKVPQANGRYQIRAFTFKPNTPVKMTQSEALIFLDIDPCFRVRNTKGQIVRPRRAAQKGDREVIVAPHEVVVPVTAVLKEALYEMARSMPGGDKRFTDYSSAQRPDLEEFIISGGVVEEDDADKIDFVAA